MSRGILAAIVALSLLTGTVAAQNYSFSVPRMELHVHVNPDASVRMDYEIVFENGANSDPLDIVDLGLPHRGYDISNMQAVFQGEKQTTIRRSEFVTPGVEIPLKPPLAPGQTGTFQFACTMPDLVYQDTTDKGYASLQITPTWFGGEFLRGNTDLLIAVYLPKELQMDAIKYQKEPFTNKVELDEAKVVAWHYPSTRLDGPHKVGVSFPKDHMERVIAMSRWGLLMKWFTENPLLRFYLGAGFLVLFAIFFFRLTAGTGGCLFVLLTIGLIIAWSVSAAAQLLFLPVLLPVWILAENHMKRKRSGYLPAIASVPGGGIKRGLTAAEAAVILEQPLGRVLTLIVFGMLKKGLVRQLDDSPLTVEVVEDYHGTPGERRAQARANGTVIRGYEQPFLTKLLAEPGVAIEKLDLRDAMKNMVKNVAQRMAGFDLEESKEYYLSIVNKAWQEAKAIGEVEERTDHVDNQLLWMMLSPGYDEGFTTWHRRGYRYSPPWTRAPLPSGPSAPSAPPTPVGGQTSLGEVTGSFASWAEGITGRLAGTLDPVSVGLVQRGVVNLSGVDKVTGEMLKASSSGGGGGGGGCACACAGCACACACAGGGR